MDFSEKYNNELQHLEEMRKSWQPHYDKMGVKLTIADAKEIRDNLCDLAKLLWSWEEKEKNDSKPK